MLCAKNHSNRLTFDRVIKKIKNVSVFETQCTYIHSFIDLITARKKSDELRTESTEFLVHVMFYDRQFFSAQTAHYNSVINYKN